MADFKFSCPKCRQEIFCDSSYVGQQINCPSCQQPIVVPPMTPAAVAPASADGVVQIKKSTLMTIMLAALSVLLIVGISWGVYYIFAGPKKMTFRAYVDGSEVVKLRGRELWIEHLTWQQPTKISINGKNWQPVWNTNSSPSFPMWNDNTTAPYPLSVTFKSSNPKNIKLKRIAGRGDITIAEKPSFSNGQTLGIKVDDGPQGGADWYEFTVSW